MSSSTPHERACWQVVDAQIHEELSQMLSLDEAERQALVALKPAAEAESKRFADSFYGRLMAHPNTAEFFEGVDLEARHQTISQWFAALFSGQYDADYVERRLRIGVVHVRIGLPVRYPLAMMDLVMQHAEAVATTAADPNLAKSAVHKVIALDVAVFNQAYEHEQLKHLSTLVGSERLARRLLMGEA